MDIHSKEVRSYNMSRIKGKNSKPEVLVRKYLFSEGFRYRINYKKLIGHPDIVLPKYRTAIFINGCFWHAHEGCPKFVFPKSNTEFWKTKFEQNKVRDEHQYNQLKNSGWQVIVIWTCQLTKENFQSEMLKLISKLHKDE